MKSPTRASAAAVLLAFSAAVFLSAFLLFLIQPLIGKCILPWFGSAIGVWTTCMLFFQILLLAGYAHAHLVVSRLSVKRQALLHIVLVALALATLPITPDTTLKPDDGNSPAAQVLKVLTLSVGLPFFVVCSTGPLLLSWLAQLRPGSSSPYRLYALSNLGSLLALLSYPFWFERILSLRDQTIFWSLGFFLFALLSGLCAWTTSRLAARPLQKSVARANDAPPPAWSTVVHWLLLSATGSALMLATTNQLCLDLAVVPLLWVLPLGLYLLSFILCFSGQVFCSRAIWSGLFCVSLIEAVRLLRDSFRMGMTEQVIGYSCILLAACMCCHGELARRKPDPGRLTLFFLIVSLGGATGGACVAVLAPWLLNGLHEYGLSLVACYLLVAGAGLSQYLRAQAPRSGASPRHSMIAGLGWTLGLGAILWGLVGYLNTATWVDGDSSAALVTMLNEWQRWSRWIGGGVLAVLLSAWLLRRPPETSSVHPRSNLSGSLARAGILAAAVCGAMLLAGSLLWLRQVESRRAVVRDRNFYGTLAVKEYGVGDSDHRLSLVHGRIRHGSQFLEHRGWPTTYYGPLTGAGFAIQHHPARQATGRQYRIGVVGLGAGTLAAYANAWIDPDWPDDEYAVPQAWETADSICFYELNPMVVDWAEARFSFLRDARARGADVHVNLGDARIVMERQLRSSGSQRFDVLVLDAFSSDAIPVHLLTLESLHVYFQHLRADGILAIHVSNRFVDLVPVCTRLAAELDREVVYLRNDRDTAHGVSKSQWLLMTVNRVFLDEVVPPGACAELPPPGPLWTDDSSSIFEVIR